MTPKKRNPPATCYVLLKGTTPENGIGIARAGVKGLHDTGWPRGGWTEQLVTELNADRGISKAEAWAMKTCAIYDTWHAYDVLMSDSPSDLGADIADYDRATQA